MLQLAIICILYYIILHYITIYYKVSGDVHAHVCASCDKMFTRMDNLKRHMKQQHCDDGTCRQKKFFIPFNCNKGLFRTSGDIMQHCNTAHNSNLGNTHNIIYTYNIVHVH